MLLEGGKEAVEVGDPTLRIVEPGGTAQGPCQLDQMCNGIQCFVVQRFPVSRERQGMERVVFREAKAPERNMQEGGQVTQGVGIVDVLLAVLNILDIARQDADASARPGPARSELLLGHTPPQTELLDGFAVMIFRGTQSCHALLTPLPPDVLRATWE